MPDIVATALPVLAYLALAAATLWVVIEAFTGGDQ